MDSGHFARDGKTWVPGVHFTDKAYQATDISAPVDELIKEIIRDGD